MSGFIPDHRRCPASCYPGAPQWPQLCHGVVRRITHSGTNVVLYAESTKPCFPLLEYRDAERALEAGPRVGYKGSLHRAYDKLTAELECGYSPTDLLVPRFI